MRKPFKVIILGIIVLLAFSACSSRFPYRDAGLVGEVIAKDYEVLGPVSISADKHNVLGFVSWGGLGYNDLLNKARELYPETDAVINITEDINTFSIFIFYNSFGFDMSGLAIKYVDNVDDHAVDIDVNLVQDSTE